jgi:hypothetical protein
MRYSARMLSRMRIGSVAVSTWALAAVVACQATPSAAPPVAAPARLEPVGGTAAVAPAQWPPTVALTRSEYEKRLSEASAQCEQFDLGALDGHWIVVDSRPYPAVGEVWMCDGHIRWRGETGQINDICMSRAAQVPGGLNAEGTWQEDLHHPEDASGLYVRLRKSDERLRVDVSSWDAAPSEFSTFFSLVRLDTANGHEACPAYL